LCHFSCRQWYWLEEEYNDKVFEVFQRLHGKENMLGGLAIVKKL
jgi:light-regulated signal transduction histidine kinase (bacteriophytochrome)